MIPHVFLPVKPQDFTIKPFRVHKLYSVSSTDYSASGYTNWQGVFSSLKTPVSAAKASNDPKNSDGSYQHIQWQAINHLYYRDAYNPAKTSEHSNRRYTYKHLDLSCSIWSAPYLDYGDGIKRGSVQITSSAENYPAVSKVGNSAAISTLHPQYYMVTLTTSTANQYKVGANVVIDGADAANIDGIYTIIGIVDSDNIEIDKPYLGGAIGFSGGNTVVQSASTRYFNDDGYGNLYAVGFVTSSYTNRNNLVAYWGFNQSYRGTKYGSGIKPKQSIGYTSHIFEPDQKSLGKNILIQPGVLDWAFRHTGHEAGFSGTANISTHDREEFNFDKLQDFTIAFWIRAPISQSVTSHTTNTLISKRGTVRQVKWGKGLKLSANNVLIPTHHMSQSIDNEATTIYPYHFEITNQTDSGTNGIITFNRSDGSKTVSLSSTSSIVFGSDGQYKHIVVTKSGSLMSLYVDGVVHQTGSDVGSEPINKHMLLFGAENINNARGFSGSLDEIRFYNYAAPQSAIATLGENKTGSMYQTSIQGNVFYKNGTIVTSSPLPRYNNVITGSNWTVKYRNTHTIFQNECLVRIRGGDANMSMNPTARISANSDRYMGDMTSSLLKPYITAVGLYNHKGELVAVGKMGQPIAKRDDVTTNILIRWDM